MMPNHAEHGPATESLRRKGIVLAGGRGSRLFPTTLAVSKQLLPIYDKPMVYYSLSVLMLAGIRDVMLITTPDDLSVFKKLLGAGERFGINIEYGVQAFPGGLAEAFEIGADFIGTSPVCLVLGDNFFYGQGFTPVLKKASARADATLFAYPVKDPQRFGVVGFDSSGTITSLVEKPLEPASNYAVTGLYFFDNDVVQIASKVQPSARGEKEIIDVLDEYRKLGRLHAEPLGRGFTWLDAGTPESLLEAGMFVQTIEHRQGLKVACLEEIAWRAGWLNDQQLQARALDWSATEYGIYLQRLLDESGQGALQDVSQSMPQP